MWMEFHYKAIAPNGADATIKKMCLSGSLFWQKLAFPIIASMIDGEFFSAGPFFLIKPIPLAAHLRSME